MARMYHREYWVTHGRDGFALVAWDRWLPYMATEFVVGTLLAAVGHPCCGRGLGRIRGVDYAAFVFLNLPNRLARFDRRVLELPMTVEQAFALRPDYREDPFMSVVAVDGTDEFGYTWQGGVMVGTPDGSSK